MRRDFRSRALRDDRAAVHSRARSQVDDVIGLADRILVVLDHDHRIAEIAQIHERVEQALIIALVQSDGGLVEDVHDAHEAGSDLACEADALRLSAGQRVGAAVEREITESDIRQKTEAVGNFLDDLDRDFTAPAGELEAREELQRTIHAER